MHMQRQQPISYKTYHAEQQHKHMHTQSSSQNNSHFVDQEQYLSKNLALYMCIYEISETSPIPTTFENAKILCLCKIIT